MAGIYHVKPKSKWKKVEIPTEFLSAANFDDLIEIQELSDYDIDVQSVGGEQRDSDVEQTVCEKKKKKKRRKKKKKTVSVDADGNTADAVDNSADDSDCKEREAAECQEDDSSSVDQDSTVAVSLPSKKRKRQQVQEPDSPPAETSDDAGIAELEGWDKLGVPAEVLQALREEKFMSPTPIQALTIPHAINHRLDIVGAAETGSGKTLAFSIPIIHHILQRNQPSDQEECGPAALILEPTRELALQVKKHIMAAARHTGIKVVTIVGGMAPQKQARLLKRKPEIVIATPGRLWELIEEGESHLCQLPAVQQLVVDEADRMIERGHFEELTKILGFINSETSSRGSRQTYVFSATLSLTHSGPQRHVKKKRKRENLTKLDELVQRIGLKDKPKVIDLTTKEATAETLMETRINCRVDEKDLYLYYLLRKYGGRTLVFCNSKDCIRRLVSVFALLQRDPLPLHADMHQRQRLKNLDRFTEKTPSLLLASDVAARGLDIPGVDHVIHYQVPRTIENYVHRSGRTARASKEGLSITLVSPDEVSNYRKIVKDLKHGEDLPEFPIQTEMLLSLKPLVAMATSIDKKEHKFKSDKRHNGWLQKAAEEMDIDMDEDLLAEVGSREDQAQLNAELAALKKQLAAAIRQPMVQATFSGKYPTKTGQLVMPKSFMEGSALQEARGVKRKRRK